VISLTRKGGIVNLLVRDVPEAVVAALDSEASRLGLSRSEYLRRTLTQISKTSEQTSSVEDLAQFAETFSDLADPEVMGQAWQ
jgi:hypothetical protein